MSAMEGSAFTNILKMMRSQGYNKDCHMTVGKVVSTSPLKFEVNGLEIDVGDFFIVQSLTEHTREVEEIVIGQTSITDVTFKSPLANGDLVLVLIDGNSFFIIDKVVSS